MDRSLLGGKRIHLGAYETSVLASVSLCTGSAVVFQGSGKLLVCQTGRDSPGACTDPGAVLHLQRSIRQIPGLDQHRHLLYHRIAGFSL